MTPLEIVREIQADCERDAAELDGKPMTGRQLGEMFGGTLAMIKALAVLLEREMEITSGTQSLTSTAYLEKLAK